MPQDYVVEIYNYSLILEALMKILLAIDGSKFSEAATQALIDQFRPQDNEVMVLSVVEQRACFGYPVGITDEQMNEANELVKQASQKLRTAGFHVESAVCTGDARTMILDSASEWHANLIVLGSHGHSGVGRLLLGSVSEAIVHHAPCSVKVVRLRES